MSAKRIKHRGWKRIIAAAMMGCLALLPLCVNAQDDESREYKIEAAYLYNFFNYITWPGFNAPQDLHEPVICIYENDQVEPYLIYIQKRRMAERQISIRHIEPNAPTTGCHIVFLGDRLPDAVPAALGPGSLVVSARQDSINHGAMIELFLEEERIRMKINQGLLDKDNFRSSSRLLSLAEELKK